MCCLDNNNNKWYNIVRRLREVNKKRRWAGGYN
jgi:hypothetical protein